MTQVFCASDSGGKEYLCTTFLLPNHCQNYSYHWKVGLISHTFWQRVEHNRPSSFRACLRFQLHALLMCTELLVCVTNDFMRFICSGNITRTLQGMVCQALHFFYNNTRAQRSYTSCLILHKLEMAMSEFKYSLCDIEGCTVPLNPNTQIQV